jgi:hypothetical protein
VKIIASIENPAVVGRILAHLEQVATPSPLLTPAQRSRGPPGQGLQDLN